MSTTQSAQSDTLTQYSTVFDSSQALKGWSSLQVEGWFDRWNELRFEEENGQQYLVIEPKVSVGTKTLLEASSIRKLKVTLKLLRV